MMLTPQSEVDENFSAASQPYVPPAAEPTNDNAGGDAGHFLQSLAPDLETMTQGERATLENSPAFRAGSAVGEDIARPGFIGRTGANLAAARDRAIQTDAWTADSYDLGNAYEPLIEALNHAQPDQPHLVNPYGIRDAFSGTAFDGLNPYWNETVASGDKIGSFLSGGLDGAPKARMEDLIWQRFAAAKAANPGAFANLPQSRAELMADIQQQQRTAVDSADLLARNSGPLSGGVAQFVGQAVTGLIDPPNLILMAAAGGLPAETLLKTFLAQGSANAAATLAGLPGRMQRYDAFGEPMSLADAAEEVAGSFVVGGGLAAGGHALAHLMDLHGLDLVDAFRREIPDAPPSARAAATAIEGYHGLADSSALDASDQGVVEHVARVQAATNALNDGRPDLVPSYGPPLHVEAAARALAPDLFAESDVLHLQMQASRARIAELASARQDSPPIAAADEIGVILAKVHGVESRLTDKAATRLADLRSALFDFRYGDTPEMAALRQNIQDADYRMRDIAPQIAAARRAAHSRPDLMPPPVTAPSETITHADLAYAAPRDATRAVAAHAGAALQRGDRVTLVLDGTRIPIARIAGGVLYDDAGRSRSINPLLHGTDDNARVEIAPSDEDDDAARDAGAAREAEGGTGLPDATPDRQVSRAQIVQHGAPEHAEYLKPFNDPVNKPDGLRKQAQDLARELAPEVVARKAQTGEISSGERAGETIVIASRYADLAPKAARAAAERDALNRTGSYRNAQTGWSIELGRSGIEKSLSGGGTKVRAEIVVNLPELLEKASLTASHADAGGRAEIAQVHRFAARIAIEGHIDDVKLTVREDRAGTKRHYAVEYVEVEPARYLAPAGDRPAAQAGSEANIGADGKESEFGPAQGEIEALRAINTALGKDAMVPDGAALLAGGEDPALVNLKAERLEIERQARAAERLRGCVEGTG